MIRRIISDQKIPVLAGALFFALLIVLAVISLFDTVEIMGINRWIKPMKFALSLGVYLWTLAVYLYFIPGRGKAKKVIGWGVSALMAIELAGIIMQAARGTTSHFNIATPFDDVVFNFMGLMITVNTGLIFYLLYLYFRETIPLPRSIVWGMRIGIIIFLVSSFEGGFMIMMFKHSVGVADGGPGLPFVNWSTTGGDLRSAHFIGMHALQAVPIFAYAIQKLRPHAATGLTIVFGVSYFLVFTAAFLQAMAGRPLI